jgi:hypothetical protein
MSPAKISLDINLLPPERAARSAYGQHRDGFFSQSRARAESGAGCPITDLPGHVRRAQGQAIADASVRGFFLRDLELVGGFLPLLTVFEHGRLHLRLVLLDDLLPPLDELAQ